jgi:hypothetical protein
MSELHVLDDLGAFALGVLDRGERAEVESHLRQCSFCSAEAAGFALPANVLSGGRIEHAPAEPWQRIQGAIAREDGARDSRRLPRFARVGALAAALALVGWNVTLQLDSSGSAPFAPGDLARAGHERLVSLEGAASGPEGRLYISEDGTQGGLAVTGLASVAPPETYAIWFVRHDQSRASGGTFRVDARGQALVRVEIPGPLSEFEGVSVTREPAPGAASPAAGDLLAGPLYER